MERRRFLAVGAAMAGTAILAALGLSGRGDAAAAATGKFPVAKSDDEWRRQLTADQFAILREEATERPYTSALLDNKKPGTYRCVGCDAALYASQTKYDSGTGWPSFWEAVDGGVGTATDYKLVYPRTEVHCATCGGHLGHIFDDGPKPTGKRHCINGLVLAFTEAGAPSG